MTSLVAGAALLAAAPAASCLTIVATYDTTITGNSNGPAMIAAIQAAIDVLESSIADNFTVYLDYVNNTNVDLGENNTWIGDYSYPAYIAVLKHTAADANDTNADSRLATSPTDPVIGGSEVVLTLALARHLGLDSGEGPDGFDSTISLNMPMMNFSRPPRNPGNFDLQSVVAHEMDEVIGTSSALPDVKIISAMDLFRYATNLARTFTTNGDNAYFSVDGTNLWARFNQQSDGDYGDYWSSVAYWAPPGKAPAPQVQDAFADPGVVVDLGTNELTMLDVVGWTLSQDAAPISPALSISFTGPETVTLFWPANFAGYTLEESTNLASGVWVASPSGSENPAVITLGPGQKFYRLVNSAPVPLNLLAAVPARTGPLRLSMHVLHPRRSSRTTPPAGASADR